MNRADFWRLIDESRHVAQGDCELQSTALQEMLRQLQPQEIIEFDNLYMEVDSLAYRHDLRAAAYIINGSGSDDGFTDFRAWLISHGELIFAKALENVESLADIMLPPDEIAECEQFAYVPLYAYESKTGTEMPSPSQIHRELVGDKWVHEDLPALYPLLRAIFMTDGDDSSVLEDE